MVMLLPVGSYRRTNSFRRCKTAREELPESIHTSSVSLDLLMASAPFQSFGFTSDQSSAADFSNHTFEPCFSTNLAVFLTTSAACFDWVEGSGTGLPDRKSVV